MNSIWLDETTFISYLWKITSIVRFWSSQRHFNLYQKGKEEEEEEEEVNDIDKSLERWEIHKVDEIVDIYFLF